MTGNLEYYKVFYYAARLGSLTAAAAELSISQPAVSQALKQLERTLDTRLFLRSPKGIVLTTEGQVLYEYVRDGYEKLAMGEKKLLSMHQLTDGELRIGASDMTLKFYLLPLLEKFHEKYPGIRVMVTNAPTPETMELLKQGKIDFGVVSTLGEKTEGTFFTQEGIRLEKVREIEDVFVAGSRFSEYQNRLLSLKELEKLPVISLQGKTSTGTYVEDFLKKHEVRLRPEFELATSDMIVQFALRNLGVGSVVRSFAQEYLEDGRLFELQLRERIPKRHICVVTDEKAFLSRAAEAFLAL